MASPSWAAEAGGLNTPRGVSHIPGLYNPGPLEHFQDRLASLRPNDGGVTILGLGDSLLEGANASSGNSLPICTNRWWFYFIRELQNRFNPTGCVGGIGFVPAFQINGNSFFSEEASWTHQAAANGAALRRSDGSNKRTRIFLDGAATDAIQARKGVSSFIPILATGSGSGTIRIDVSGSDAFVTAGTGSRLSTSIEAFSGAGTTWSVHFPSQGRSILVPTQANCIQLTCPAATAYFDGLMIFNGDENQGVRGVNLGYYGSTIGSIANYFTETIANWQPIDLLISNFITNDVGTGVSPTTTKADFKASVASLVDRYLNGIAGTGGNAAGRILWTIPHCRDNANAVSNFSGHADAIYEVCDTYSSNMSVFNLWEYFSGISAIQLESLGLVDASDGVHYKPGIAHPRVGRIYSQLLAG